MFIFQKNIYLFKISFKTKTKNKFQKNQEHTACTIVTISLVVCIQKLTEDNKKERIKQTKSDYK